MADSGVELATAQVVEEVQEEAEALGGAEAPKDDESPAVADGTVTTAGDHKRKLDDLEPGEGEEEAPLKKQEVSADDPALAADEPGSGDGEVAAAGGLVDRSDASAEALFTVTLADEVKSDIAESGEPKLEETGAVDVKSDAQEFQPGGELDGSGIESFHLKFIW
ncbi:hypothetical protein B296_00000823 [Ensete ventricosum]|uniref:Uncharacterized protein n=1 Tax=Ensete ventricosum TaxID=4639 RepID=A0A427B568_ENSVE|nr:hypothetical protein B296_00000823 [Ensete ventricosum]